jgi:hypothetical protein
VTPDITTAILEGRQPPGLTATMLIEHPALPMSWQQRTTLGFVQADSKPNITLVARKELERANCSPPSSAGASMPDRDIRVIWRTPSSAHQSLPTAFAVAMPQTPGNSAGFRLVLVDRKILQYQ